MPPKNKKKKRLGRKPQTDPHVDMKRNEEWRPLENTNNIMVSNLGRVRRNGKLAKQKLNRDGYYTVSVKYLDRDDSIHELVHRLVAKTFLENPDNLPVIDHISGIKTDNRASNLRWCTVQQNTQWAYEQGLMNLNNKTTMILAYNIKTKTAKIFRNRNEMAEEIGSTPTIISSCLDKRDRTVRGYLVFRINDLEFMDTIGEDYFGQTINGGVWAAREEGNLRLKLVDDRDNPMTQKNCIKVVNRLFDQVIGVTE